ncbi:hypothetical protein JZ751_011647 [Albula glossodonta]|uniref:Uncharacterized protein n=1 Tax=Albula glossodonta TaxID=121402 RepID=A0A8T2PQF1_9TELE|nr:hypothetical protein JZ751_011647 [Albula glossodonta]
MADTCSARMNTFSLRAGPGLEPAGSGGERQICVSTERGREGERERERERGREGERETEGRREGGEYLVMCALSSVREESREQQMAFLPPSLLLSPSFPLLPPSHFPPPLEGQCPGISSTSVHVSYPPPGRLASETNPRQHTLVEIQEHCLSVFPRLRACLSVCLLSSASSLNSISASPIVYNGTGQLRGFLSEMCALRRGQASYVSGDSGSSKILLKGFICERGREGGREKEREE